MVEYIERGDLIARLEKEIACCGHPSLEATPYLTALKNGYKQVLEIVKQLSTADVEEVRHGEWEEYWDDNYLSFCHKCSECGNFPLTKEGTVHDEVLSVYCPHCGADMRGGKNGKE
jgi:hypothetical protein